MDESYTDRFRQWCAEQGISPHALSLKYDVIAAARQLVAPTAKRVEIQPQDFERRLTHLTLDSSIEVDGYAHSSDGWATFGVTLNVGLLMFLHNMLKVIVSAIGVSDENDRPLEDTSIPFEHNVAAAQRVLRCFWQRTYPTEVIDITRLSDDQTRLAGALLSRAERFIIAHEFAHIADELAEEKSSELGHCRVLVQTVLDKLDPSEHDRVGLREKLRAWPSELAADIVGLRLCLAAEEGSPQTMLTISAAEVTLILLKMLDAFHEREHGRAPDFANHPPGDLRLHNLRNAIGTTERKHASRISGAIENVADGILSQLGEKEVPMFVVIRHSTCEKIIQTDHFNNKSELNSVAGSITGSTCEECGQTIAAGELQFVVRASEYKVWSENT